KVHIRDFFVLAGLDENYQNGTFNLNVEVENFTGNAGNYTVEALVTTFGKTEKIVDMKVTSAISEKTGQFNFDTKVENPEKWSAEQPNLYKLLIALKDSNGKTVEALSQNIGFRTAEIKNGQF